MPRVYAGVRNALRTFNYWMAILSALLILFATLVLTYEVVTRYFMKVANDWVIELCIFLLIAATFLAAGYTQAERGHVGIEVLDEVMSPRGNRIRQLVGDVLSLVVVAVIARNAWHYMYNAYQQGWATSSTWGPPLWIPYFFMAFGLSTLGLQMLIQIVDNLRGATPAPASHSPVAVVAQERQVTTGMGG
jgi:TRAP-type C4-dicarboxylate transport system permease small subunit